MVEQWLVRSLPTQEIAGSSPAETILRKNVIISWYLKFTLQSESDCKGGNVTKEFKLKLESDQHDWKFREIE